jgi:hypothetical protein
VLHFPTGDPLLALLYKLEVRIKVVPLIIFGRLRRSRLNIVVSRDIEFLLRLARLNIALKLIKARLIDSKTIRVLLARYQINPPLISLRQDVLGDVARVLVRITRDGDYAVAACDFVVLEPVIESCGDAGAVLFDVFEGVHVRCDRVVDVDDHDLPVGLAAVIWRNAAQDFGLSNLTEVARVFADVEKVNGVVVAFFIDELVLDVGVLPRLRDLNAVSKTIRYCSVRELDILNRKQRGSFCEARQTRQSAVRPFGRRGRSGSKALHSRSRSCHRSSVESQQLR